jgi:hypothetical protein
LKIKSWLGADRLAYVSGAYGGCVIKGYRSQMIPTNLVLLLLGGLFNLFAGAASGVEYSATAEPAALMGAGHFLRSGNPFRSRIRSYQSSTALVRDKLIFSEQFHVFEI